MFQRIYNIAIRECKIMLHNHIYIFCLFVFPLLTVIFFTTLLKDGQPIDLPVGIVDLDNTSMTRKIIRSIDAQKNTKVAGYFDNVNEARKAIQNNEIYAFVYIPKGTTSDLFSSRQPRISFYYTATSYLAGNMVWMNLKTITTLSNGAVASKKLAAMGKSPEEIASFVQPIAFELHRIGNPMINYNIYLSVILIAGILLIFVFLITPYSIGTELKFNRSKEWLQMAGNNIQVALIGKLFPQTIIFLLIFCGYQIYVFYGLNFPHPGGFGTILLLSLLAVLSGQGFGIFMSGFIPSLRISMSVGALWSILGFSMAGFTFPVFAMHPLLEAVSMLFPLRHVYMIYQISIFNGYPLSYCWFSITMLVAFALLPIVAMQNIKKQMLEYVYIP